MTTRNPTDEELLTMSKYRASGLCGEMGFPRYKADGKQWRTFCDRQSAHAGAHSRGATVVGKVAVEW